MGGTDREASRLGESRSSSTSQLGPHFPTGLASGKLSLPIKGGKMLTRDDIRAAALALPEAFSSSHFEVFDFRVNRKIFCTLHPDHPRMVLKLDPEDQHNL